MFQQSSRQIQNIQVKHGSFLSSSKSNLGPNRMLSPIPSTKILDSPKPYVLHRMSSPFITRKPFHAVKDKLPLISHPSLTWKDLPIEPKERQTLRKDSAQFDRKQKSTAQFSMSHQFGQATREQIQSMLQPQTPIKRFQPEISPRSPIIRPQSRSNLTYRDQIPRAQSPTVPEQALSLTPTLNDFNINSSTKFSVRRHGNIYGYAASTDTGIVRTSNEDRVSIVLSIQKPPDRASENWPSASFFGVYDGHGGSECAEFLKDNLHHFIIQDDNFPYKPREAIKSAFQLAEEKFMERARGETLIKAGSCAIVLLVVADNCYVANVGDSRAVMSGNSGSKVYSLSNDHKPGDPQEQERIQKAGGRVYQSQVCSGTINAGFPAGPLRIFPGRLSVSRSFGDIEAKVPRYGGNPNVLICTPDIRAFKMNPDYDFILLGCDGIFDKLSNKDVVQSVWDGIFDFPSADAGIKAAKGVERVLQISLMRKSLDNVTAVLICFENAVKVMSKVKSKVRLQDKVLNLVSQRIF